MWKQPYDRFKKRDNKYIPACQQTLNNKKFGASKEVFEKWDAYVEKQYVSWL